MADNSFETIFSVEFEDFNSVKNKLETLKKKIGNSNTSGIQIDVDTTKIKDIIENVNKLSKTNIQILPNGQIKAINTFNEEIGKTIKLTNDLTTGQTKVDITQNYEKQAKAVEKSLQDRAKIEENYNNWWLKALKDRELKAQKEEENAINKIEEKRQNTIQKRIAEETKLQQAQAKAINKGIESARTEEEKTKKEIEDIKKIIEIERQRLQIKQKNIELSRGSLIDGEQSKNISSNISSLNGKTLNEVKDNAKKLNLELQQLDQNAKMKGVALGQKNVSSLGDAFKSTASKLGIFLSTTMVIRQFTMEVKQATQYIMDMDKSLTNIMMITGKSSTQVSQTINEFKMLGEQLHTTNREIMSSSEEILRAGYDTDTSKKMVEASIIGSKVSGQTSQQVTEQLIAIKNAFNMTGEELNGVIDKMARLDNTSATSFQELAEATKRTAFSAQEMGTSFEDLLSYIATASEKTRKPAETIGESFKSIYSRFSNIKLGNLDEDGKSINDVEKALGRLNIKLRDGKDSFRDFDFVLKEFMDKVKSGDVSQVDKLAVVQALAGTRQKETLMALIENTDALAKHQEDLANSTGMAKEMFDNAYSESLDAKVNDLKRSFEGLYESLLNSSTLKFGLDISTSTINGVTQLAKTFGTLPTIITGVVGILTIFNSKMRENASIYASLVPGVGKFNTSLSQLGTKLSSNIELYKREILIGKEFVMASNQAGVSTKTFGLNLLGLNAKLALTTAGLVMTKVATVALNTAMTMGLSLVISGVISWLGKMVTNLYASKKSMDDCKESAKTLADTLNQMKNNEKLFSDYSNTSKQLEDINLSEERRNELNEKLEGIKQQIYGVDDKAYGIINDQNLSYAQQLEVLKNINAEKLFEQATEVDKTMVDQSEMEQKAKGAIALMHSIEQMEQKISSLQGVKGAEEEIKQLQEVVGNFKNDLRGVSNDVNEYNGNVNLMGQANYNTSRSTIDLDNGVKNFVNSMKSSTDAINENTSAKQENNNTSIQNMSAEEATNNVIEATKAYGEANSKANELRSTIAKINEEGYMTPDMISKLAESYGELGFRINDTAYVQDFLNQKLQEQITASQDAYNQMLLSDSEFYQQKIANSDEFHNALNEYLNQFVTNSGQAYDIDLSQFSTLQDLKNNLQNQFGDATGQFLDSYLNIFMTAYTFDSTQFADLQAMKEGFMNSTLGAVANWVTQFTGGNAQAYSRDLSNFNDLSQAKAKVLADLNAKLNTLESNYANLFNSIQKSYASVENDPTVTMNRALHYTKTQINAISTAIGSVDKVFSGLETSLSGYTSSFSPGNFKGGSVGNASSKGSGGGSKSKSPSKKSTSQAKKDEEDYQREREQMEREANSTIESYRNKLIDALKKKYEELKEKELAVYDKEIEAKQKQLDRLRNGYIDENEKIAKLEQQLNKWKNDDSAMGLKKRKELEQALEEAKLERDISDLEKQKEKVNKKYDDLLSEQKIYQEANNMIIKNQYDKQLELLKNYGDDFKDIAHMLGKNVVTIIKDTIKEAQNALKFLKGTSSTSSKSNKSSSSSSSKSKSKSTSNGSGKVTKGSKVKVSDLSSAIYVSSSTGKSSGTWKGAGVSGSEGLYVTNMANNRVALGRNNNINSTIGWIDLSKIKKFKDGGITPPNIDNGALAMVHSSERILTAEQTKYFEKLIDMLPMLNLSSAIFKDLKDIFKNIKNDSVSELNYHTEFNINNNGSELDHRRMDNNIEKVIKEELRRGGKLK